MCNRLPEIKKSGDAGIQQMCNRFFSYALLGLEHVAIWHREVSNLELLIPKLYFEAKTPVIIIIIIIIISAHKSDLSNPWSQTQASLSIPSLHPKTQIKEEKEEKITDEKASPDLIGGEGKK